MGRPRHCQVVQASLPLARSIDAGISRLPDEGTDNRMKPIDNNGRELDAIFSVDPTPEGAYVILESRGGSTGGRPPRNEDYAKGLELLLTRLGMNSATLIDVEVYSGVTKKWPIADRLIGSSSFSFPLPLASLTDKSRFRNELGVASAALGRSPGFEPAQVRPARTGLYRQDRGLAVRRRSLCDRRSRSFGSSRQGGQSPGDGRARQAV